MWSPEAGPTPDAAWYVVQAKRHKEERVVRALDETGVRTFLPFIEVVRFYRTRRVRRLEPLFPSYVFVELPPLGDSPAPWSRVRWTPGVRAIVGTEDGPVAVPDEAIVLIQDRTREFGFLRPGLPFGPGARVRIRRGPFEGLLALFDRPMSREGRVRVLLTLLGQERRVEVDLADLESA